MAQETKKELTKMMLQQWQDGAVAGRELISMSLNKIKVEAPQTTLTISQIIEIVDSCKMPFEDKPENAEKVNQ